MIDYAVDGDGVATITWNVQDRPVNVLNPVTIPAFHGAVERALGDEAVKGVVIASAKDDFIAGADLEHFLEDLSIEDSLEMGFAMDRLSRAVETSGKPFCAAINGHALGGGLEVALACHHRVAADNPKTRVGLPEVTLGLFPGGGGTQRVPRMIGIQKGLEFMLEGRQHTVTAAHKMGLIDEIVPQDKLLDAAKAWVLANPDAKQPWDKKGFRVPGGAVQSPAGMQIFPAAISMTRAKSWGNYPAPQAILSCVYEGLQVDIDTGLRIESKYFANTLRDPRTKAMIRTVFFAMGDARKLKSRPADVSKAELNKVGVLGAGMMGAGIAFVSARAGLEVALLDTTAELAEKGKARYAKQLEDRVKRGRMGEDEAKAILGRIHPTENFDDLAGSNLVIEAVFENREIKADVTRKAEAAIGPDALFASNTSTLPITGLAEASGRPESFIGLHFFSPVERMPLVEVIRAEKTTDECLARSMDYVQKIRMTPVVVNDSRGFFTSRVFATFVMEGMAMVGEGVNPALIENASKIGGMPVGALDVIDATSLSLMADVRAQWKKDLGDAYVPHPADDVLDVMVGKLDRSGRKAGKGFYDYPSDGSKRLWPGLAEHFPRAADQPSVEEVRDRLMHIQALEALRCREENVVTSRADADVGSVLGWGFPVFTGGVVSYVSLIGAEALANACKDLAARHGERFAPPSDLASLAA